MFSEIDPNAERGPPARALSWQIRRGYANANRLAQDVSMLAVANGATCLGRDEHAATVFEKLGLGADAIASVLFRASGMTSTVAVPTIRTWNRPSSRRLVDRIAGDAFAFGRLVIASPHDVARQPRLANAARLCRSMCPPAAGDARAVEACIAVRGVQASLRECEAVLGAPLALQRIFGLMVGGFIEIDLESAFGADSAVRLRPRDWIFDWSIFGWRSGGSQHADSAARACAPPTPRSTSGVHRPGPSTDGAVR